MLGVPLAIALSAILAAGAGQSGEPETWSEATDALVAAPGNHKVILENDKVRVLEVTVPPATTEPVHSHRWPSVIYVTAGGHFIDRDGKGAVKFDSRKLGAPPKLPATLYRPAEPPHAIENLDKTVTMRLIRVEMKQR